MRLRLPDVASLLVLVSCSLSHLAWAARDARIPWDLGLFYAMLPSIWHALGDPAAALTTPALLLRTGGWYNLVLALLFRVFGRSILLLHLVDLFWVLAVLTGVWALARGIAAIGPGVEAGGARVASAGFVAVGLTAATPLVADLGRIPWIHLPEAALCLWALVVFQRDRLRTWRGTAALALCGALAASLRPSGLVWLAPIACGVVIMLRTRPWRRIATVGLAWALGAVPSLLGLPFYLSTKIAARSRYAEHLPSPGEESLAILGAPFLLVVGLGIGLLVWRREWRQGLAVPVAWAIIAVGLTFGFRSGLFNHTLLAPSLATCAAVGLSGRGGMFGVVAVFILSVASGWLPTVPALSGVLPGLEAASPFRLHRVWRGYGAEEASRLLERACPSGPKGCIVAVEQGLMLPFSEDPGMFEVFLLGEAARLTPSAAWADPRHRHRARALVTWRCDALDAERGWSERNGASRRGRQRVLRESELMPEWTMELTDDCSVVWSFAPLVRGPLPSTGRTLEESERTRLRELLLMDGDARSAPGKM